MTAATPVLHDPSGEFTLGGPETPYQTNLFAAGATRILFGPEGGFRGVYVDDTTPNRDQVAITLRGRIGPGALVVVAIRPAESNLRIPGCVMALEWYPFGNGFAGLPLPQAPAYITQWAFAYPGHPPPTADQREELLADARSRNPILAWVY